MEAILFLLQTVRYTILVLRDRTCVTNYVLRNWRAQGFDLVVRTLREERGGGAMEPEMFDAVIIK